MAFSILCCNHFTVTKFTDPVRRTKMLLHEKLIESINREGPNIRRPGRPRREVEVQPPSQQPINRPTRNRHQLQRYVQALFLMLLFVLVASEPQISDGVFFHKNRQIIFSNSEWVITTDVTYASIIENIRTLRTHLTSRAWNETHL